MPRKPTISGARANVSQANGELQRRKELVLKSLCGPPFIVVENSEANGDAPWYEMKSASMVNKYKDIIENKSKSKNVDPDLVKSIMYMETTHGYYDFSLDWIDKNKSILPMNINTDFWGDAFGERSKLKQADANIEAGSDLLFRIKANMPPGASIAQIATVYNNLGATKVSDYGARVEKIYKNREWEK